MFMINLLYSSTNQQLFKENKVATMKIMDNFCYEWNPSYVQPVYQKAPLSSGWSSEKIKPIVPSY